MNTNSLTYLLVNTSVNTGVDTGVNTGLAKQSACIALYYRDGM